MRVVRLLQAARDFFDRIFPTGWLKRAISAHERLADALRVRREIVTETPLGAKKFAIDAAVVAIVGAQNLVVSDGQRRLASVRAVSARGAEVFHLPRTRLVTIRAACERTDRADVNAHAALFAGELAGIIGNDH